MPACPNPACKNGNQAVSPWNYHKCPDCNGKGYVGARSRPLPALQSEVLDPSALTPALLQNLAKMARGQNSRARQAGYKDHAEREAAGWTPLSGIREAANRKRAKTRVNRGTCDSSINPYKRKENPFLEESAVFVPYGIPPLGSF